MPTTHQIQPGVSFDIAVLEWNKTTANGSVYTDTESNVSVNASVIKDMSVLTQAGGPTLKDTVGRVLGEARTANNLILEVEILNTPDGHHFCNVYNSGNIYIVPYGVGNKDQLGYIVNYQLVGLYLSPTPIYSPSIATNIGLVNSINGSSGSVSVNGIPDKDLVINDDGFIITDFDDTVDSNQDSVMDPFDAIEDILK